MAISLTVSVQDDTKVTNVYVSKAQDLGLYTSREHGIVAVNLDGSNVSLWTTADNLRSLAIQLAGAAEQLEKKLEVRNGQLELAEVTGA